MEKFSIIYIVNESGTNDEELFLYMRYEGGPMHGPSARSHVARITRAGISSVSNTFSRLAKAARIDKSCHNLADDFARSRTI